MNINLLYDVVHGLVQFHDTWRGKPWIHNIQNFQRGFLGLRSKHNSTNKREQESKQRTRVRIKYQGTSEQHRVQIQMLMSVFFVDHFLPLDSSPLAKDDLDPSTAAPRLVIADFHRGTPKCLDFLPVNC